ncbi:winged helix-turn-helix domain-containing tetratricopeptide repeat protein [Sphingomicrobium flavum]|uniref:winged helix-turn-helix domain-containing tetratricopeptide repeat protein n=1 Tax=Sphingomicrobium flavum TaxID=1229164 RepID=UPI0021AE0A93|nr:winged helix-turn-helix domain-containing protein [Sphingomicrobium flavum]
MAYRFGPFIADTDSFTLTHEGAPVELQPRTLSLLFLLLEKSGRLVSKDVLIEQLWDGRAIGESTITSQVKALRKALGDTAKPYRYVETVHGQGLRFNGAIDRAIPAAAMAAESAREERADPVGERPSIAILPFRLGGDDGHYAPLAEALPDEIITQLSRMRWLNVIARGSSFQFPSILTDVATVRDRLGVGYCLSGMIRPEGNRLIVSVELAETKDETVIWADRFKIDLEDVYALRAEIVGKIVSLIDFHVPQQEASRARLIAPENITAWQAYHLGISNIFTFGRPDYAEARSYLTRATELSPHFARAHAGLSHLAWWAMIQQSSTMAEETRREMFASAERAIESDQLDSFASLVKGRCLWFEKAPAEAAGWFQRSVDQSPSFSMAHAAFANLLALDDKPAQARPHIDKAMALSPVDPWLHNMYGISAAIELLKDDFASAAEWATKAMSMPHDSLIVAQVSLLAMHHSGDRQAAKRLAQKLKHFNARADQQGGRRSLPIFSQRFLELTEEAFSEYGVR